MIATHQNLSTDLDMGGSGPAPRNWKGIGIAVLVIVVVLSLVIVSIFLLTPEDATLTQLSKLTFADLGREELRLQIPQAVWTGGEELIFRTREGHVIKQNMQSRDEIILVENGTFHMLKATKFQVSPDLHYALLAFNVKQIFRYSFTASYAIYNIQTREVIELNPPEVKRSVLQYAAWGPQGSQLVFIFENNLYYQHDVSSSALRLTSSGKEGVVFNGISDWLYEEQVLQSNVAHWWSSDGARLAYIAVNDSLVPTMELPQFLGSLYPTCKRYPYPKAGQPIPQVKLQVVNLYGPSHTLTLVPPDTFRFREYYVTMVKWINSTRLAVQWLSRPQNFSVLSFCEATTGACIEKHRMISDAWIMKTMNEVVVSKDGSMLYLSIPAKQGARGEFSHLAVIPTQPAGTQSAVRFLTSGNWEVTSITALDEERQKIYILSTEEGARRRHLYSVDTTGSFQRYCVTCDLIPNCSFFHVEFSPNLTYVLLHCRGPGVPRTSIHQTINFSNFSVLEDNGSLQDFLQTKDLPTVEFVKLSISGYDLPMKLSLPSGYKDNLHAVLMILDEVPGSQLVTEEFKVGWDTVLASMYNVIVVHFDSRGSGYQGVKILRELHHRLGTLEVKDYIAAAEWLMQQPYVDRRRIGVYGKAYGGYLMLKLMAATSGLLKCGVAVAPITDFRIHAAMFSERYLGLPSYEDTMYAVASLLEEVPRLQNEKLFLIHGTGDATVHFQHTAELLNRLIKADINYTSQNCFQDSSRKASEAQDDE
ncbi:inactive dipeptidyl peptidase 10-like isoform X2 [Protopterus annectens]|uniref:inactive dipeptidyl peptidase 10-like isoform X2 n=1 Tax=Protopterus annectens TaxID=7888 RepID=UPI001CFB8362|nr:inactive dipeptidyl peptidase 10-like isoform X2 [Protopterus annectens]